MQRLYKEYCNSESKEMNIHLIITQKHDFVGLYTFLVAQHQS